MPKGSSSRAASLLKKVNRELSTIPDYKFNKDGMRGGTSGVSNMITALRRGVRALQGKESKPSLVEKRKKLQSLIKEAEQYKGAKVLDDGGIAFGFGKDD